MNHLQLDAATATAFPERPFTYKHDLAGHRLLSLAALADLAGRLDRDRVEYNSGRLQPNQKPDETPAVDLPPAEVIRQIETAGAWMVLKNVETVPEYHALIAECLAGAAKALGHPDAAAGGMTDFQGFIFVSSANAVTPFHIDYEENFFVHLHGEKFMHVFDNRDRSLVSEEQLEIHPGKHRNLPYQPSFEEKATVYRFHAGDGLFLPYTWPHWVRNGSDWSISMAITWKSPRDVKRNKLYFANAMMRKLRLPQGTPGKRPAWDGVKVAAFTAARAIVDPLRRSEGMRRRLRALFFGRKANYYYRAGNGPAE